MRSGNFRCQIRFTVFRVFRFFACSLFFFCYLLSCRWSKRTSLQGKYLYNNLFGETCWGVSSCSWNPEIKTLDGAKHQGKYALESRVLADVVAHFNPWFRLPIHVLCIHTHVYWVKKPIKHTHRGNPDPFAAPQQKLLSKQRGVLEKLPDSLCEWIWIVRHEWKMQKSRKIYIYILKQIHTQ